MSQYSEMIDVEVGRYALRTFNIQQSADRRVLGSIVKNYVWTSGAIVAQCLVEDEFLRLLMGGAEPSHSSPNEKCHCGIYGAITLDALASQYHQTTHTIAVFAAEGETLIGDRGLRTAAARIVAYWCLRDYDVPAYDVCEGAQRYTSVVDMLKAYGFPPSKWAVRFDHLDKGFDDRMTEIEEVFLRAVNYKVSNMTIQFDVKTQSFKDKLKRSFGL